MNLINKTPHNLNIVGQFGITVIEPSLPPTRCKQTNIPISTLSFETNVFVVTTSSFGAIEDLPEPEDDTYFVVSRIVAEASGRKDLLIPGPAIRNDVTGQIIGCDGLSRL